MQNEKPRALQATYFVHREIKRATEVSERIGATDATFTIYCRNVAIEIRFLVCCEFVRSCMLVALWITPPLSYGRSYSKFEYAPLDFSNLYVYFYYLTQR